MAKKLFVIIVLLIGLFVVSFNKPAFSYTKTETTLEYRIVNSDYIIIGKISKIETKKLGKKTSDILTFITIDVEEYLKGFSGEKQIIFTQLGGNIDGKIVKPSNWRDFRIGEKALLFLTRRQSTYLRLIDTLYGKYIIEDNKIIRHTPSGLKEPEELTIFKSRIKDIINQKSPENLTTISDYVIVGVVEKVFFDEITNSLYDYDVAVIVIKNNIKGTFKDEKVIVKREFLDQHPKPHKTSSITWFKEGEKVLLFLKQKTFKKVEKDIEVELVGGFQSQYTIIDNKAINKALMYPELTFNSLLNKIKQQIQK